MRWEWHLAAAVLGSGFIAPEIKLKKGLVILLIFVGSVGIDIVDHGIYGVATIRPLTIEHVQEVGWEKYRKMEPGFYFFHLLEIYALGWVIWLLTKKNPYGLILMLAWSLHLLMDGYQYIAVWGNLRWLRYWTIYGWIS